MRKFTDLSGVYASGIHCGIYPDPDRLDLAFVYVPQATSSAAVFTQNKFRAAPIEYTEECLKLNTLKAVIINSGNANAATGEEGLENSELTSKHAAKLLGLKISEVAVASTGIIGEQLPIQKIIAGLVELLENPKTKEADKAAEAILTLDTKTKFTYQESQARTLVVSGFAKGAGMIAPNMGTMLGFLLTNADISSTKLRALLKDSVEQSFNMVSVDTDTSTNDMVLIFGTGEQSILGKEEMFAGLLTDACTDLAKQIAADGEGAEKLIEVNVSGASSQIEAKKLAKNIVNSPLVKTAIHGADPNWGRIMMAAGKDPSISFSPEDIEVRLADRLIFKRGAAVDFSRNELIQELQKSEVKIDIKINSGQYSATAWGCDLTKKYIDINTEYN